MASKNLNLNITVNNKQVDLAKISFKQFDEIIKQAKKDLQSLPLNDPRYKTLVSDINAAEKAWKQARSQAGEFNEEMEDGGGKVKSYAGQIREATAELVRIEQQFGKNSKQYADQAAKIKGLRDAQEDLVRGTQKLDDALSNIPGPIGRAGQAMQQFEIISQSAKSAFNSLGLGFKTVDQIFKTTAIGALVAIIVLLVSAVANAAKSFKPLQDAFAQIGGAVDGLFEALKPITEFILNIFVGAIKAASVVIELLGKGIAMLTGRMEEYNQKASLKKATLDLERNIKQQETLLNNYGQAINDSLKDILNSYKEFNEKKKLLLEADYQNEKDRQADVIILQLGFLNFLKQNNAEREKLYQQFQTDVDNFENSSQIRKIDNQREAQRLSTKMQKQFIGESARNELDYQKARMKALKDDEAVLRKLTTENAKKALAANVESQKLLKIEMVKLETKGFQDFVAAQEEQDK